MSCAEIFSQLIISFSNVQRTRWNNNASKYGTDYIFTDFIKINLILIITNKVGANFLKFD